MTGIDPDALECRRRWAAEQLGLAPDASTGDIRQCWLRRLGDEAFVPSAELRWRWQSCCSAGPAAAGRSVSMRLPCARNKSDSAARWKPLPRTSGTLNPATAGSTGRHCWPRVPRSPAFRHGCAFWRPASVPCPCRLPARLTSACSSWPTRCAAFSSSVQSLCAGLARLSWRAPPATARTGKPRPAGSGTPAPLWPPWVATCSTRSAPHCRSPKLPGMPRPKRRLPKSRRTLAQAAHLAWRYFCRANSRRYHLAFEGRSAPRFVSRAFFSGQPDAGSLAGNERQQKESAARVGTG